MRILSPRLRPLCLLLLTVLGCDGGPTGPSTGRLRVAILGLPPAATGDVTVAGPNGFSQPVTATQTLTQLTPGTYTVSATAVMVGASQYAPAPLNQTVVVNGGDAQSNASVFYSSTSGNLTVTINGLGTSSTAAVTVTGPGGYTQNIPATTTLTGLNPGDYVVNARDTVATGGTSYTASPSTQTVSVTAQSNMSATVTYSPPSAGSLNLKIDGLYITQSTQVYPGTVPLVKNRNGYLRVFVVANRTNNATPQVRVRFFSGLVPLDSSLILPSALSVPTTVDESSLSYTWNVPVSGTLIQPGLNIQAEVDPGNTVVESDETDNVFPAVGLAATDVRTIPVLSVTFVPILQSTNSLQGNVTEANKNSFLDQSVRMHPIDAVDAIVRSTPMTTTTTLQSDGTGWVTVLSELRTLRLSEGGSRYYYGVVKVGYSSGVAGIGYVSDGTPGGDERTAMGWDASGSASIVAAHELAHNWARLHAPCGGAANPDLSYPYSGGVIGAYGLDVSTVTPKSPSTNDVMGYCDPKWISDYNYKAVMNYRLAHPLVMSAATSSAVQPSLIVWGHMSDGKMVLEPAFQVNTRPSLPSRPGPYSIEGRATDGSALFSLSFSPDPIADLPGNSQTFAFAVPMSSINANRLTSIRLSGQGQEAVRTSAPQAAGVTDGVEVRRRPSGRVGLHWNAAAHPMVVVRDPETGQVLSFARGGSVELSNLKGQVDLLFSDGVKSKARPMRVTR
jgi:hypothetical protein